MSQSTLMKIRNRISDDRDADYKRLCFNVNDFQVLAKKHLRKDLYEYLASGSDDEQTLAENRLAFKRWFLYAKAVKPIRKHI